MKLNSALFCGLAATFAFEATAFSSAKNHAAARQTSLFAMASAKDITGKKSEEEKSMPFAADKVVLNPPEAKEAEMVAEKVVEKVVETVVIAPPDPMKKIFKQNAAWVESKTISDPDYFAKLGSVHKPKYMWIGE
jgi:ABC-type enterochelin transport system substrate-binding protein